METRAIAWNQPVLSERQFSALCMGLSAKPALKCPFGSDTFHTVLEKNLIALHLTQNY